MISKAQISFVKSLHQKKYRSEYKLFLAEGYKLVIELLHTGFKIKSLFILSDKLEEFKSAYTKFLKSTEIFAATQSDMERISTLQTAPEVIALVYQQYSDEQDLYDEKYFAENLSLCLDGIKDPGNIGTLLRIADWFGIKRIICSNDCVELYNPKVVQASMGSISRVSVYYTELKDWIGKVVIEEVYGALLEGENVYAAELNRAGLLILGSESHGISEELRTLINRPLTIPLFGGAESLNVAVAGGILCSEFMRR